MTALLALLANVELKFERAEMQMDVWRFHETELSLSELSLEVVVGCDGMDIGHVIEKCMQIIVEGRRPVGRPRETWLENVEADMPELEIDRRHLL